MTINARNNSTDKREELIFKYFNYCFIEESIATLLKKKYGLKIIEGYTFYTNGKKCSKVYFDSTSEMERIINVENVDNSDYGLTKLKPAIKFLLDKKIKYRFAVNPAKVGPTNHNKVIAISTDNVDNPKVIYADIEVDNEGDIQFPSGDRAIHPVISASFVCPNDDIYWICLDTDLEVEKKEEIWDLTDELINPTGRKVNVILYKDERELLKFFGEIQRKYQSYVMTGWNFIRFDAYYLIGRAKVLGLKPDVIAISNFLRYRKFIKEDGRENVNVYTFKSYYVDCMQAFIDYYPEKQKYNSLNAISKFILGDEYSKFEMNMSISESYQKDKKSLMYYNVIDSILVKMIDEKARILKFFELRRKKRGLSIADIFGTIKPIDHSLLYFAEEYKVALPDERVSTEKGNLKGAEVYTEGLKVFPYAGMYDYKSEYPSIAASHNCSSTTLVEDPKLYKKLNQAYNHYKKSDYKSKPKILDNYTYSPGQGNAIFFENITDSFERKFFMNSFEERTYYFNKKYTYPVGSIEYNLYDALEVDSKLDGNGLYGAWKNRYFRLSKLDCARAITGTARNQLRRLRINSEENLKKKVALSDTDSADIGFEDKGLTDKKAVELGYEIEKKIMEDMNQYVQKVFLFGSKNGHVDGFDINKDNTNTHWTFAKFEKLFKPFLTTGKKKNYAYKEIWKDGRFHEKPKYVVKGFPCIKRDASPILKTTQMKLIRHILDSPDKYEKTKVIKYIKSLKRKMYKKIDIDELSIAGYYKQRVSEYSAVGKGNLPPIHAQAMCNSMANFGINFEPLNRFNYLRVKRIKAGKYDKTSIVLDGANIIFDGKVVGYNRKDELPKDFFEYFEPDYEFIYDRVIIKKNEIFFKLMGINPVVLKGQSLISDFKK